MTVITEETRTEEQRRVPEGSAETAPRQTAVSGIVDITSGHGYLRTAGYRRSPGDIPLTQALVRLYGLRTGDRVEGTLAPRERGDGKTASDDSDGAGSDGKATGNGTRNRRRTRDSDHASLTGVTAINGLPPDETRNRPHFDDLTPVYPN